MVTLKSDWLIFCDLLHDSLIQSLSDIGRVRDQVAKLLPRNSFRESCFCKGCVLPVVDKLLTHYLTTGFSASRHDVHRALRCQGFDTPLYDCTEEQVGFSSHSRSNSYHAGSKRGPAGQSRRSPDFCVRFPGVLRIVGELKYVPEVTAATVAQVVRELRDYLSVDSEPTSDWGHDFGYGLVYAYDVDVRQTAIRDVSLWNAENIFITVMR